jgi:propionyl-CoA carboxylase alpha chain
MFKKILIANRGEIACRVIRTCKALGIETVAVYSEADADALHVEMADQAVLIGPPPAIESYLKGEKIIKAAKDTGAEAIHPGYGFLAENAKFVEAVEKAGLVFIGPSAGAITAMGDKIASKKLAEEAGVNTIPGADGEIRDAKAALKAATEIGFPVMIKASAGGGGKGMRIAQTKAEVEERFAAARREAKASFGDERILIEKFIEQPRHIEVQVLGDRHGNLVHLFERECSIQRRHQKVIEEAPSPFLDEKTRAAMGAQALALARAVDYHSAGTVEFIVDQEKNFYFLEMNTRLQVEHPVTEMITGLDLVAEMIRIAAGEKLRLEQKKLKIDGWSIEARIYAEDPYRGFLPSIGRLSRHILPRVGAPVRVDTGVAEGTEISIHYDPLIAKLITFGADRAAALQAMRHALDAYYIRGIAHNLPFLSALMVHPRFVEGRLSTAFIEEEYRDGFFGGPMSDPVRLAMISVALFMDGIERAREASIAGPLRQVRPMEGCERIVFLNGERFHVEIEYERDGPLISIDGAKPLKVISPWKPGQPVFEGGIDGRRANVEIDRLALGYRLTTAGVVREVRVLRPALAPFYAELPQKPPPDTTRYLTAPMPGLVVSINVEVGEAVSAGQALAVVEAMKMENILRAERDGRVAKLHAAEGDSLAVDAVIMEFD